MISFKKGSGNENANKKRFCTNLVCVSSFCKSFDPFDCKRQMLLFKHAMMPIASVGELLLTVGVAVIIRASVRVNNARIIHDMTSLIDSW